MKRRIIGGQLSSGAGCAARTDTPHHLCCEGVFAIYVQECQADNAKPARIIRHRLENKTWSEYTKFCVERNPWDKTLSHYYMLKDRAGGELSIDEYFGNADFCHNLPIYADNEGNVLVDRVLRYENLVEELSDVFSSLGVPFDGNLGVRAKSEHRPVKTSYEDVLSQKQVDLLRDIFADEIQLHGY